MTQLQVDVQALRAHVLWARWERGFLMLTASSRARARACVSLRGTNPGVDVDVVVEGPRRRVEDALFVASSQQSARAHAHISASCSSPAASRSAACVRATCYTLTRLLSSPRAAPLIRKRFTKYTRTYPKSSRVLHILVYSSPWINVKTRIKQRCLDCEFVWVCAVFAASPKCAPGIASVDILKILRDKLQIHRMEHCTRTL